MGILPDTRFARALSSVFLGKEAFLMGARDAKAGRRRGMHWSTCFFGAVPVVLMAFAGKINGYQMGQMLILVSGIVYYLGGVHFDRRWMLPGLVMIAGSAVLTFLSLVIGFWRTPAARAEESK